MIILFFDIIILESRCDMELKEAIERAEMLIYKLKKYNWRG